MLNLYLKQNRMANQIKTVLLFLVTDKSYPGAPRFSPKSDGGEWDKEEKNRKIRS